MNRQWRNRVPEGRLNFRAVQIGFEKRLGPATTLYEPLPFPLSSRAKPRDLQFRGPFLEPRNPTLKQNCHLACSGPNDKGVLAAGMLAQSIDFYKDTCLFSFNPPTGFIAEDENSL